MALRRRRHAGTPVLYERHLQANRVAMSPMAFIEPPAHDDELYPFVLARGRVLNQPERAIDIRTVRGRNTIERDDLVTIDADDAESLGIVEGDEVHVMYDGGGFYGTATIGATQRGMLSVTALFGEMISDIERDRSPDPMLKIDGLPLVFRQHRQSGGGRRRRLTQSPSPLEEG